MSILLPFLLVVCRIASAQAPDTVRNVDASVPVDTVRADDVIIRPGDVLRLWVWPDVGLGGEFAVEETGVAYLPTLGEVRAAGMSLRDLRQRIRDRYGEVMKMPVVSVTVSFRVLVVGAVGAPGIYRVDPTLTVFDAIALAGGLAPNAKRQTVRIERNGAVLQLDARRALETGERFTALHPQSGDRIVVPGRKGQFWKRVFSVQTMYSAIQMTLTVASLVILLRQ